MVIHRFQVLSQLFLTVQVLFQNQVQHLLVYAPLNYPFQMNKLLRIVLDFYRDVKNLFQSAVSFS